MNGDRRLTTTILPQIELVSSAALLVIIVYVEIKLSGWNFADWRFSPVQLDELLHSQ